MADRIIHPPIHPGQRFGRWTVLEKASKSHWLCRCDCGTVRKVYDGSLKSGASPSCGCIKKERITKYSTKHGLRYDPLYPTWLNMIQRCENPKNPEYKNYGARGISVCPSWRESFENFHRDMGPRPPGHTVERRDNSGNYESDNCYWATPLEQGANRRDNNIVEWNGERMILSEACRRAGIKIETVRYRLKIGWSIEDALNTPVK